MLAIGSLFLETCSGCGGAAEAGFCRGCAHGIARVIDPCPRCGLARPVAHCPRRAAAWSVLHVAAPFAYCAPLDRHIHALKYRGARRLGRAFALLLAEHVAHRASAVDALVPVPLHPLRLRYRGYNQAVEIARALGAALDLPVLLRGVVRRAAEAPQTGRGAAQRRLGAAGAFEARRRFDGQRFAIVDDVLTTGATVNALGATLLAAGAASCEAWAVARTPEL
jgi:ComF family protein